LVFESLRRHSGLEPIQNIGAAVSDFSWGEANGGRAKIFLSPGFQPADAYAKQVCQPGSVEQVGGVAAF